MPSAVGSMLLPSILPSILPAGLGSALGGSNLFSSVLGGGLGSALGGDDFWKGALGGLAGGLMPSVQGTGFGPMMGNALRGAITSGIGGGNPLQGALFGGLLSGLGQAGQGMGGVTGNGMQGANSVSMGVWSPEHVTGYDTFMGNQMTPFSDTMNPFYGGGSQNMLRSISGMGGGGQGINMGDGASLMKASYQPEMMGGGAGSNWASAFGDDTAMRDFAGTQTMGLNQSPGMMRVGNQAAAPQQPGGGSVLDPYTNYLKGLMAPEKLIPALGQFGMDMYKTKLAEDMADKQMDLAREMDTGLGLRKQAARYATNPDSIPGSPGYQAALNERRRAQMRLASAKGGLRGGALPKQLSTASDELLGNWFQYYANTANRGGNVPYPNYQNMLRSM